MANCPARKVWELCPQPGIDEYGPAAATHHCHIQRPVEHVRRQEHISAFEDTPEELVELFSITGTPEECRQKLDLYKDLPHVALHSSYTPPFDAAES
jgi:hypothetical protein